MLVRRPALSRYADRARHPDWNRLHPGRVVVVGAITLSLLGLNTVVAHGDSSFTPTPSPFASLPVGTAMGNSVLTPTSTKAPIPTTAGIAKAFGSTLRTPALGNRVGTIVVDALTGATLYNYNGALAQQPASTMKLLTSVAVLSAYGPDYRLATRVVRGSGSTVVLVGGGDASLVSTTAPRGIIPEPARLSTLADRTAAALKASGQTKVGLQFDDHLFIGPRVSPAWPPTYVSSGIVAPVSALSVDQGRRTPTSRTRVADPALVATTTFVTLLKKRGVSVVGRIGRVTTSSTANEIARVESPPLADLVERMLTYSDNDLAEAMSHLAGAATGNGSFAGGAAATSTQLVAAGVSTAGLVISDGSGLARTDRVTAVSLGAIVSKASTTSNATWWPMVTGLPVAGATGTLATRFDEKITLAGRGVVRAKTGTLTSVSSLAGLVRDRAGRLLAFAVIADRRGDLLLAERALDRVAAALARCGCK